MKLFIVINIRLLSTGKYTRTINDDISLNFNKIISSVWSHCLPVQLF